MAAKAPQSHVVRRQGNPLRVHIDCAMELQRDITRTRRRQNEIDVARFHRQRRVRLGNRAVRIRPRVNRTPEERRQLRLAFRRRLTGDRDRRRHNTGDRQRIPTSHHFSLNSRMTALSGRTQYAPDGVKLMTNRPARRTLALTALAIAGSLSTIAAQSPCNHIANRGRVTCGKACASRELTARHRGVGRVRDRSPTRAHHQSPVKPSRSTRSPIRARHRTRSRSRFSPRWA